MDLRSDAAQEGCSVGSNWVRRCKLLMHDGPLLVVRAPSGAPQRFMRAATGTWSIEVATLSDVQHFAAHGKAERQRRVAAAVPHQARQRDVAHLPRPADTATDHAASVSACMCCEAGNPAAQTVFRLFAVTAARMSQASRTLAGSTL